MADFSIADKFNKDKAFSQVVFGADTPLLEVELNELQKIQTEGRADVVRKMIHSGVLEMTEGVVGLYSSTWATVRGQIQYALAQHYLTNPLTVAITPFYANINGHVVNVAGFNSLLNTEANGYWNRIPMPEPPITGERYDLVFLEAWFEEIDYTEVIQKSGGGYMTVANDLKDSRVNIETSRRVQLKWRFRTVTGVDFNKVYSTPSTNVARDRFLGWNSASDFSIVTPQGGNSAPLALSTITGWNDCFRCAEQTSNTVYTINDYGLWIAGGGNQQSKDLLKTVDGYVYAIPMMKIRRRSTEGYSVTTPWGSINAAPITVLSQSTGSGAGGTTVHGTIYTGVSVPVGYDSLLVGDTIGYLSTDVYRILSKDGSNTVTLQSLVSGSTDASVYYIKSRRPDGLFSNIIDASDITDLRHYTPVTDVNYRNLLSKEFDKFCRNELGDKQLLKTYHGIRKTPVDANHILYASFDHTTTAEVGGTATIGGSALPFVPSPTGAGLFVNASTGAYVEYPLTVSSSVITVDCLISNIDIPSSPYIAADIWSVTAPTSTDFGIRAYIYPSGRSLRYSLFYGGASWEFSPSSVQFSPDKFRNGHVHIRTVVSLASSTVKTYINGTLVHTYTFSASITIPSTAFSLATKTHVGCLTTSASYVGVGTVSDFSISNIDRGSSFATLPVDFIAGYAQIANAFNGQNITLSDAQTSQNLSGICHVSGSSNTKGMTRSIVSTPGIWSVNDTVKVAAMSGEVITGLVDGDTAVARVISDTTSGTVVYLDSVSGLAVSDAIQFLNMYGVIPAGSTRTITAIDSTNKTITVNTAVTVVAGMYIVEATTASSAPVVKTLVSGTVQTVPGTWAGLGTAEATFTITSLPSGFDTEDVQIDYALVAPSGRHGINEILIDVLQGSANGKKLIPGTTSAPIVANKVFSDMQTALARGTEPNGYNSDNSTAPSIIKDGSVYKCWFAGTSAAVVRILYSTSADGITWTTPVLAMNNGTEANGYNSSHSSAPCVIKDGATYKMWFIGYNGSTKRILYATSSDGITWTTPLLVMNVGTEPNGYNNSQCESPCVIKDGSTYKMWFAGGQSGTGLYRVLYSTSTNGTTWENPVLAINTNADTIGYSSVQATTPCVIKDGSTYRMWFTGYNGNVYRILYATSADGTTWTIPTLYMNNGVFVEHSGSEYFPCVVKESGVYKLWITTNNGSYWKIMYATITESNHSLITADTYLTDQFEAKYGSIPSINKSAWLVAILGAVIYPGGLGYGLKAITSGFTALVPEDPLYSSGLTNVLFVRPETKEVRTLMPADMNSGIVTYGMYTPYQGVSALDATAYTYDIIETTDLAHVIVDGSGGDGGYIKNAANRFPIGQSVKDYLFLSAGVLTEYITPLGTISTYKTRSVKTAIVSDRFQPAEYGGTSANAYNYVGRPPTIAPHNQNNPAIRGFSHSGAPLMSIGTMGNFKPSTGGSFLITSPFICVRRNDKKVFLGIPTLVNYTNYELDGNVYSAVDFFEITGKPLFK